MIRLKNHLPFHVYYHQAYLSLYSFARVTIAYTLPANNMEFLESMISQVDHLK